LEEQTQAIAAGEDFDVTFEEVLGKIQVQIRQGDV
jgi:hypothetical protein